MKFDYLLDPTWIDIVVSLILISSCVLSSLRGLMHEVSSLIVWIVSVYCGLQFGYFVADAMPENFTPELKIALGFIIVMIIVLILSKLVVLSLKETVIFFGGGSIDRFLGSIFGLLRGFLIIVVLSILAGMTALPSENAWQKAFFRPILESSIKYAIPYLPDFMKSKLFTEKTKLEMIN